MKKGINLTNPNTPKDFDKFIDCKSRPSYIRHSGDTIFLYSWNGSSAQTLKEFKKTTKDNGFNTYNYPSLVQGNGTVIVNKLSLRIFIWRNDTLYMFDDYNSDLAAAEMTIMFEYFDKKISKKEYETKMKNLDRSKYPFTPKFKTIFFKGIFDNDNIYIFSHDQNFKEESVEFIKKYEENNVNYIEINLKTYTDGRFRFSDDLKHIERNNCKSQ